MSILKRLRQRREMKNLYAKVSADMPRLESLAMARRFDSYNNYFACGLMHSEVKRAFKIKDYESLLVYARYLELDLSYEAVWHAAAVLRETTDRPISGIIADNHVRTAAVLLSAFNTRRNYEMFKPHREYREVLKLSYHRPDLADRIVDLVIQRDITDASDLLMILENAPDTPLSLSSGML